MVMIVDRDRVCRSAEEVEQSHSDAQHGHEGREPIADDGRTAHDTSEAGFVGLDEGGPDAAHVGGSADEEQHHDDHAVEAEEGALC
jgi:hypothetical protein